MYKRQAQAVVKNQYNGYYHVFRNFFRVYLPLLRIQRTAYRKLTREEGVSEEIKKLISDTFVSPDALKKIIAGDIPANVLCMIPSLSLNGDLGILISTIGKLSYSSERG